MKILKNILTRILPNIVIKFLNRVRTKYKNQKYTHVSLEETWNDIYEERKVRKEPKLSGAGSYGELADEYVSFMEGFIGDYDIKTITDVGCGDFHVGSQIHQHVTSYIALDVSSSIIEHNKIKFSNKSGVQFINKNACSDPIPSSDLITIRQVLQHLTNREIELVLKNVQNSSSKYALVSEHCYALEKTNHPNLDLNAHGDHTRVIDRSGVYITPPPFSREAKLLKELRIPNVSNEYLYVYLWDLSPDVCDAM